MTVRRRIGALEPLVVGALLVVPCWEANPTPPPIGGSLGVAVNWTASPQADVHASRTIEIAGTGVPAADARGLLTCFGSAPRDGACRKIGPFRATVPEAAGPDYDVDADLYDLAPGSWSVMARASVGGSVTAQGALQGGTVVATQRCAIQIQPGKAAKLVITLGSGASCVEL